MNFFDAIVLGVVEGVTEFLPVSSTAHLIVVANFLGLQQTEFVKTFEIAIQAGSMLAILLLLWHEFIKTVSLRLIAIAFLPTLFIGVSVYPFVREFLLGNLVITAWALIVGGILLFIAERLTQGKLSKEEIQPKNAFLLGLFQTFSFIPGFSRSGALFIGGMFLGFKKDRIAHFSFLLAVPTIFAAAGKSVLDITYSISSTEAFMLCVGFLSALCTGLIVARWFLSYIQTKTLVPFSLYRIVAGLGILIFVVA